MIKSGKIGSAMSDFLTYHSRKSANVTNNVSDGSATLAVEVPVSYYTVTGRQHAQCLGPETESDKWVSLNLLFIVVQ